MTAVVINFPKPLKPRDEAFNAACAAYEYFDGSIQMMEAALVTDSRGIISGMHNVFGGFRPEIKNKFLSFMNKPSFSSWLAIRDYLVDLSTTSWQLWLKYDPHAPQTCSKIEVDGPFPKPDDFIRYYSQHKSERLAMLMKKRDEALAVMQTYE
jgi:hypothetical protein